MPADPRRRDPARDAEHESRRHHAGRGVVRSNVGTPWESAPARALPQVRRARQQPRLVHVQPARVAGNVARQLYEEWFPQIVYNQHQEAPFPARIFVPPFDDPMNPNIPPLVDARHQHGRRRHDAPPRPGGQDRRDLARSQFDTWWNGGMRTAPVLPQHGRHPHRDRARLGDAGHLRPREVPDDASTTACRHRAEHRTTRRRTSAADWHIRDSCDYMLTASMAVLDLGASRRRESGSTTSTRWVATRIARRRGRDLRRAGSARSGIRATAVRLVNTLRLGRRRGRARSTASAPAGSRYAAGSFVLRGAQAFRPLPDRPAQPAGLSRSQRRTPADLPSCRTTSPAGRCRSRWACASMKWPPP